MTTSIKVMRKDLIIKLSSIKDDNISIADIVIERRKLLEALKLQTQPDADVININYGLVSWHYDYKHHEPKYKWEYSDDSGTSKQVTTADWWEYKPYTKEPEPCIQFNCNHTIMRFMNHPKPTHKNGSFSNPAIPLNFVNHATEVTKPRLSGIPLDTQELIGALNFAIHAVETDGAREVLECVLFDCGDDTLKLVTADGFRLSIAKFTVKGIPQDKVLINRLDIIKLLAFLKSNTEGKGKQKAWLDIYMKSAKKTVKFMSEKGEIEFNKQQGTFPDYSQLIPKDGTKIECIASDMLEAVKALIVTAKDSSGIIRLKFQYGNPVGKINLSSHCESHDGENESSVDCDALVESDCRIGVNAKYLTDLLSQCGDARITLRVTTPSSPLVFDISDSKQETVMPMFVQWGDKETPKTEEPEEIGTEESDEPTPEELNEVISEEN